MNPLLRWLTSPEWTHVVGALLHSLWQGAIVAIALAVLMRRLTNPVIRYRCALGMLGGLVIAGIITWAVLNAPKPAAPVAIPIPVAELNIAPGATLTIPDSADKIIASGKMASLPAPTHWTAWLALAWMVGTMAMLLRAGIKVAGAENLRRSCKPLDDEQMLALVAEACRAVELARKIRVAVTDKLTSPAVVGVIVPTLILPLSLFSTLTPEQIRFILLHELAHIRRGDYLANLFQLFAEALLFFNPAVWWISHQIRREREACCDALAIELSGAPAEYARTLVRVAENILEPAPAAAPAFGDDGREPSSLVDRVQRLLVPGYRPSLRLTWRAMLTALFVGSALLFLSAVGTRITVAAILSPQERMERIEQKMAEYGESLRPESSSENTDAPKVEVSGRVRTADGAPLPKAKWVNIYYSRKNLSGANSARLDTNGFFKTQIEAGTLVAAGLGEPGFAPVIAGPVLAEGTNPIANLDLVLEPGFDVPILVTEAETGAPVTGALIKAQFWAPKVGIGFGAGRELKTDSTGTTAMTKCSASVVLTLTVNAFGYEIAEYRAESLKADEPIRIKLQRGQTLSGVVHDTTTTPLAGATVRMIYEKGQKESRYQWTDGARVLGQTDANGRFTINQLRRSTRYWLGISAPGHASALIGPVTAGASNLTVQLGPELIVRGRVLGSLEGLQIINQDYCLSRSYSEVFDSHSNGFQEWVPLRVENGVATFQFTNPIPGLVKLSGRQGFNDQREVTAPVDDWVVDLTNVAKQEVQNRPKREVIFRFKHPAGAPPRGLVRISVPDNLDPKNLTAHTEEREITNGEVRVEIPIGGRTQVESMRTVGYWFKSSDYFVVTNGSGPVVVELPCVAAGAIYAKARNADGTAAGGLHFGVTELKHAPGREDNGSLGGGGDGFSGDAPRKWVSGPLPLGGTYQIHAWRGNSFCISKPIKLTEANPDAEVELQFAPGQTLAGTVLDADGKPVRDAELKMSFSLANNHGFGLKPVFTDERGQFRMENATAGVGEYSAEIIASGWMTERVKLDFKSQPQTIRLKRGRTLAGRVVEAGTGYVIPGMEVRALDFDQHKLPMLTTHTDAEGRFEFTMLGDVNYTLYADGGQLIGNQKFRADGTTNLTLTVKLYEWSKLKPQSKTGTRTNQSSQSSTIKDRVPFLGDIPLVGKLFTSESSRLSSVPTIRVNDSFDIDDWAVTENEQLNKQWFWYRGGDTITWPTTATTNTARVEPLAERVFKVDLGLFYAAVRKSAGLSETIPGTNMFPAIRSYFTNAGVNLDPATGRSLFITTSRGDMWVRATVPELDAIEALLRPMPGTPLTRRSYHFDSNTLAKATAVLSPEIGFMVATNPAAGFRALLESFNPNDPRPKQVRYLTERDELYARATEADFEQFESAMKGTLRLKPAPDSRTRATSSEATNLFTRTFQVEPGAIAQAIEAMSPQFKPVTATNITDGLRALLQSSGSDLSPPKSIYYNDRAGGLFVRATKKDLEAIESLLQIIGRQPAQVNLKVRWVEVPQAFASSTLMSSPTNALPLPIFRIQKLCGVLTDKQTTEVLDLMKSRNGFTLLNEGQITTQTERQAQLQVVEMKTVVTSINPKALTKPGVSSTNLLITQNTPLGPVVDIFPIVSADETKISLRTIATVTEFLGYEKPANKVAVYVNGKKTTTIFPQPKYRVLQMTNDCVILDGQTLILGNPTITEVTKTSDGTVLNTAVSDTKTNLLFVFITATLVDSAGNPTKLDMGLPSKLVPSSPVQMQRP
jgi:beta-lactamase regulating signal transducer with metallopeptidase domain